MKYVKILSLLAVAAAALMAFAASASATTVTSPTGTAYTGTITAVAESSLDLTGPFATVKCTVSHVEGKIESQGSGKTASGKIATLSFGTLGSPCQNGTPTQANPLGSLEVHAVKKGTTEACKEAEGDTCEGTLTSTGTVIVVHTSLGECIYETKSTDLGKLTTTSQTGKTATMDINASLPQVGPNTFLCGQSGQWTGSYSVTGPDALWIDAS
ncbi:MAG TPA: hypothetical protein VN732_04295 [Solirubrobacterales bacterium]|nr:hypothetical protein [Solirubrobacterales bacterium]